MKTILKNVYGILELTDAARETAHAAWLANIEPYLDNAVDMIKEQGAHLGIAIDEVLYSGFYSQGDGAMVTGVYRYNPDWRELLNYDVITNIGVYLEDFNNKYGDVTIKITHDRHRYFHARSANFEIMDSELIEIDEMVRVGELLRSFMEWAYTELMIEYEYQTSIDYFIEESEDYDCFFNIYGILEND